MKRATRAKSSPAKKIKSTYTAKQFDKELDKRLDIPLYALEDQVQRRKTKTWYRINFKYETKQTK